MKHEFVVPKNIHFNTNITIILLLKRKILALVYFSHFGDPLGGQLGFRGRQEEKAQPLRLICNLKY